MEIQLTVGIGLMTEDLKEYFSNFGKVEDAFVVYTNSRIG